MTNSFSATSFLGAGLGIVALAENLDHSVKNADELAWLTGLPVLGRIARIVTAEDIARQKRRRHLIWSIIGLSLFVGILLFHFLVMDLWVFYARMGRLVGKYL
jgi:succinoglycan biosynthesis transport protein ExoP